MSAYLSLIGRRRGGRLLTFSAFRMGAYSRWALIRGWAFIRINTVSLKKNRSNKPFHPTTSSTFQFIKDNVRRPLAAGTVFDRAFEQARGVIALRIDSKNSLRLIRLPA